MKIEITSQELEKMKSVIDKLYQNYSEQIRQAYADENTPIKEINRLNGERDDLKPILEMLKRHR
tara:strand:+ start:800 stop:991 length:192 start_codon:yes stop_codon:yes gene_type:complete